MSFVNTVDIVGDEALTSSIVDRSVTEIADNLVTQIGNYVFYKCQSLITADFQVATSIGQYAFYYCQALTTVSFPMATSIATYAFNECSALTTADFPVATSIGDSAFSWCSKLTALILRSQTMCTQGFSGSFGATPIESGKGYIYVPRALVDSYKANSRWSDLAKQFRALEDYTVDGTITGALDESKI